MSNNYYNALRKTKPDNFFNMEKVEKLVALANAAGNTEEAIARNSQNYRSELQAITSELSKFRGPIYTNPENIRVPGRFWGINKTKTKKARNNASNKYYTNLKKYTNNTRNLRTRRNNITAKSFLIGKRSMVQRRKKNLEYERNKPPRKEPIEPSQDMIEEFKKYGYDYIPFRPGYQTGTQNYSDSKPAHFEYILSKTLRIRNNTNNGWTFNGENTRTEIESRTGYTSSEKVYKYKRNLPPGYKQIIYEDEWDTELEKLKIM